MAGLFSSFYLNLPPGGTIIMTAIIMLLTVVVAKNIQVQKVHVKVNNNR
jgi:zinc transport system permease protein